MKKRRRESAKGSEHGSSASSIFAGLDASTHATAYRTAQPYPHARLADVFQESHLLKVRQELQQLQSTFKETDLFKLYQTGDLANIDPTNPEHATSLPATIALRAALYSEPFRAFVRGVTGCAPLTSQQDCSCNVYKRGGHLLCHDDVIGTRCVSYILYLSRPGKQWHPQLGGALELYAVDIDSGAVDPAPVSSLSPEFGTMVMFGVLPGRSYHSVQEVGSKVPRLSVSGWFHAANPPEGYDQTASLAQLRGQLQNDAGGGGGGGVSGGGAPRAVRVRRAPKPQRSLTSTESSRLAVLVNPAYLEPATIKAVRAQLRSEGAALLASFLHPQLAAAIRKRANAFDANDGLAVGAIPEHAAGANRKGWRLVGPPQLRRYMRFRAPKKAAAKARRADGAAAADADAVDPANADAADAGAEAAAARMSLGMMLEEVRQLMHSAAFVQLLSAISGLAAATVASEVRRFRPGLDYTLAHVGTQCTAPTLDATLCFVAATSSQLALWDSGDVGGFECHVEASAEDTRGAAEVYRAADDTAGVTSIHAQPNALSLVLRKPEAMKFIKYVSAGAPGSRWDVAAEYATAV